LLACVSGNGKSIALKEEKNAPVTMEDVEYNRCGSAIKGSGRKNLVAHPGVR